jgi:low temperature requirement protein LtrA
VGIVVVELFWVLTVFLPHDLLVPAFAIFALCEFAVPVYAERAGMTPWHAHHVAERYGLFYIIVLGEVVLSVSTSIQQALAEQNALHDGEGSAVIGAIAHILMVAAAGVGIVFSIWWIYFSRNAAAALEQHRGTPGGQTYIWGYGHYLIFAAAALIGAALQVRLDLWQHHAAVSQVASAALLTVPLAVLLGSVWALHLRFHDSSWRTIVPFGTAILGVFGATFTPYPEVIAAAICVLLVIVEVRLASLVGGGD